MNIKQAAEQSGVSARNIRYYEQAGLLTPARNPENEYRIYSQADVRALKLIRMLRTLDMPVEDIRAVLAGDMTLARAAAAQQLRLEAEREKLAAAESFCRELADGGGKLLQGTGRRRQEHRRTGCGQLPCTDVRPCPGGRLVYRLGAGLPENGGCRA